MFYTYLWLRKDGTPYYAGKTKNLQRAYESDGHGVHRPKDRNHIITQPWDTDVEARDAEKLLIAIYGRKDQGTGCLRNLTDGGDGVAGRKMSEKERRMRSIAYKRKKPMTPEHRQAITRAARGRSHETIQRNALARTGQRRSVASRKRMSEAAKRRFEKPGERAKCKNSGTFQKVGG